MTTTNKQLMAAGALLLAVNSFAAVPIVRCLPDGVLISQISDNGRWGVSENATEDSEGKDYVAGGSLWDMNSLTSRTIGTGTGTRAGVHDVTDDGKIVIGQCSDKPAYWNAETETWTILPLPEGCISGSLLSVTPDGRRAVGYANMKNEWDGVPVAYDLTTGSIIETPNLPTVDMNHATTDISAFTSISADGRYIVGNLSSTTLMPISMCTFVYDTENNSYKFIGFTPNDRRPWTPDVADCLFIDLAYMSCNGKYVTGTAYMGHVIEGSEFLSEYNTAYKYEVETGKFEVYDGPYDSDVAGFNITDDGLIFVSVPAVNPYADMAVRHGNYYYGLAEIFRQAYDVELSSLTGSANTGKPMSVSADGSRLSMITGPGNCYVLDMTDKWEDVIAKVNLLSTFSAEPASGAVMSKINEIKLTFTREVGVSGAASRVRLLDSEGKTVQTALSAIPDGKTVTLRFRSTALETGKEYRVSIPAGYITMNGDANVTSGAIDVSYTGRREGAVGPVVIKPENGSSFSRLDASVNFIYVQFDANIKLADGAKATLTRKSDGVKVCDLDMNISNGNVLVIYPLSRQFLYDGTDYVVAIPEGSVTDLSGDGGNAAIEINYSGNYIREVSSDDKSIFHDDCQNYDGFMFYEGDGLTPGATAASWTFTSANPWLLVRESNESTDMSLCAHSMFVSPGKADDWAVTPQLYIPDGLCHLEFEAQSYKKSKTDRLKVYAYACESGYSTLSKDFVDEIRSKGQLIFDEQLNPGEDEEKFDGEWTTYKVSLAGYAEKNIYLAFVNDNEDQSAVFLHRVDVVHELQFLTSVTSPQSVVKAQSAPVAGTISFTSDELTANTIELTLADNKGNIISTVSEKGLDLGKGKSYNFAFARELPLAENAANRFVITIVINGDVRSSVSGVIKNLSFQPVKRVVIEEYSGRDCPNCPRGFVAMENLERLYPGQIIPVVLRTYRSDPLGNGVTGYSDFLGLANMGAPSGVVSRSNYSYPTASNGNDFMFSGESVGETTWLDATVAEMNVPADADIELSAVYDAQTGQIIIDGSTRFALASARNVSLFTVVNENKCYTEQENGMRYYDDPDLGEWGKGGIYAEKIVGVNIDHVARGVFGETFNGTSGLVPNIQEAGIVNPFNFSVSMPSNVAVAENTEVVVMMIDSDNDRMINAAVAPVSVINSAIEEVETGSESVPAEYYNMQGMRVVNPSRGQLLIKRNGDHTSKIIF